MKRLMFVTLAMVCVWGVLFSQTSPIADYVVEFRGDTAVVKEDMLYEAISYDTLDNHANVYLLQANKLYQLGSNPTTKAGRHTIIAGEINTQLYQNTDPNTLLPIICGSGGNTGGINWGGDLTVKNASILPVSAAGNLGWVFFWGSAPNSRLTVENCMFERTRWVVIASNSVAGTRLFIRDCYFVNLSGQACRRNGGVYDNVENNTDTIWVENTTHVMTQGMMYKFRNFPVGKIVINQNTFINCAGILFETLGYQSNVIISNNIFVNSNVQPYCFLGEDYGEVDQDSLPHGIINVRDLPENYEQVPRKWLVDRNLIYWDQRLNNIVDLMKAGNVNNTQNWYSQMIKMNSRTKAMFDNNSAYPYLVEGNWIENRCPNFTNPQDLLTDQVDNLKEFAMNTMDTTKSAILPDWRKVFTDISAMYIYTDWPVPVNLSYSDADLQTAALDGYPLGDLNWFPAKKAQWLTNREAIYAKLEAALNAGQLPTSVNDAPAGVPSGFEVEQNYPNPFNPTTTIRFTIPNSGNVVVKVFNVLGQEVATLLNEYKNAGQHTVSFDASNLPSGTYIYTVKAGEQTISKKMLLMK